MHQFNPNLSIKDNCLKACDLEFAAWELAGHDHREKFRDSGGSKARTSWLIAERVRTLIDALASGEVIAIGFAKDDPTAELITIPAGLFLSADLQIDPSGETISAIGRSFAGVRICLSDFDIQNHLKKPKIIGRPNLLEMILNAWNALKAEEVGFLDWDNSAQNEAIREMAAKQIPNKFIENRRIGESTIRRHRRLQPDLFA